VIPPPGMLMMPSMTTAESRSLKRGNKMNSGQRCANCAPDRGDQGHSADGRRVGTRLGNTQRVRPACLARWSRAEKIATETPPKRRRADEAKVTEYPAAPMPFPSCWDVDAKIRFGLVLWSLPSPREKGRSLSEFARALSLSRRAREESLMIDWDKVRKSWMIRVRGTTANEEVLQVCAPMWRKPFKAPVSKAALREQAAEAQREWQLRHPNRFRPASAGSLITSAATATSSGVSK